MVGEPVGEENSRIQCVRGVGLRRKPWTKWMDSVKRALIKRGMCVEHGRMIVHDRSEWRAAVNAWVMTWPQPVTQSIQGWTIMMQLWSSYSLSCGSHSHTLQPELWLGIYGLMVRRSSRTSGVLVPFAYPMKSAQWASVGLTVILTSLNWSQMNMIMLMYPVLPLTLVAATSIQQILQKLHLKEKIFQCIHRWSLL